MTYNVEIIIDLPRDEVIKKFDNTENMKHWQRGFIAAEHLSGVPGEVGAKMKLTYKMGKREMVITETITKRNLPDEFHGSYDTKGVHNNQENYFEDFNGNQTKWISKCDFLPTTFMMRVMTTIMPGAFKKQSKTYMVDFKNFVENGSSVADA